MQRDVSPWRRLDQVIQDEGAEAASHPLGMHHQVGDVPAGGHKAAADHEMPVRHHDGVERVRQVAADVDARPKVRRQQPVDRRHHRWLQQAVLHSTQHMWLSCDRKTMCQLPNDLGKKK